MGTSTKVNLIFNTVPCDYSNVTSLSLLHVRKLMQACEFGKISVSSHFTGIHKSYRFNMGEDDDVFPCIQLYTY